MAASVADEPVQAVLERGLELRERELTRAHPSGPRAGQRWLQQRRKDVLRYLHISRSVSQSRRNRTKRVVDDIGARVESDFGFEGPG